MDLLLIFAMITITLACIFYTAGVFLERRDRTLKKNHLILFWLGLISDIVGTSIMTHIASQGGKLTEGWIATMHQMTGALAIVLMLFHALWATYVLYKNNEKTKNNFHRFSIIVWAIWLIPYLAGMGVGIFG